MNQTIINLILWLPFLLLFAIYGTIYAISGYKKGVYKALISVGATVVAGLVSAVLAKLIAPSIANAIYNVLDLSSEWGEGAYANLAEILTLSVIQSIITMLIFSCVIFVFSIILRVVASKLSKGKFEPENKGMRWGGLSIGLLEAFIFTLILLLPLYGTLATYSPIAESLYDISVQNNENTAGVDDLKIVLSTVNGNTIVQIVKATPVQGIYTGLSGSSVNDTSINVPEMVTTCETVVSKAKLLISLPEEEQWGAAEELVDYAEKNVVGQPWVYDLYILAKNEVVALLDEQSVDFTEEEKRLVEELISSLDISKKDFNYCMKEGLDFAKYVLQNKILQRMVDGTMTEEELLGNEEFFKELGSLINCSEAVLPIKRLIFMSMVYNLTEDYSETVRLLEKYPIKIYTDEASQKKEALAILFATDGLKLVAAEGLVRHPAFGFDAVDEYVTVYAFADLLYGIDDNNPDGHPVVIFLNSNPDIYNDLLNKLRDCENTPFDGVYFHDYAWNVVHEHLSDYNMGGYNAVPWEGDSSFTYEVVPGSEGGVIVKFYG
ncbi:MAG: CvpA family protein [Clostridia bacterium]|nr:CvpA family protein [Clostridia bacterium]